MDTATTPESRNRLQQAIIHEIDSLEASILSLKSHYNELARISRLPGEVLSDIFSNVSISALNGDGILTWIHVTHVCRRWRETALSHPRLWSHINFTKLKPVASAEILSRAKMAPLHLEADSHTWGVAQIDLFGKQLEAHISHTRHLTFSGDRLRTVISQLVSPTPTLESLSLSHMLPRYGSGINAILPDNLFNHTAPSLTSPQAGEMRH